MDCNEAREILLSSVHSEKPTFRETQAYHHVITCQVCQTALDQLCKETIHWTQLCAAVKEVLPLYVADELALLPVQIRYPYIAWHLIECPLCARTHAELADLLRIMSTEEEWTQ